MGGGHVSKWGAQVYVKKTIENFCGLYSIGNCDITNI